MKIGRACRERDLLKTNDDTKCINTIHGNTNDTTNDNTNDNNNNDRNTNDTNDTKY